jgi:hypothetical protein
MTENLLNIVRDVCLEHAKALENKKGLRSSTDNLSSLLVRLVEEVNTRLAAESAGEVVALAQLLDEGIVTALLELVPNQYWFWEFLQTMTTRRNAHLPLGYEFVNAGKSLKRRFSRDSRIRWAIIDAVHHRQRTLPDLRRDLSQSDFRHGLELGALICEADSYNNALPENMTVNPILL